MEFNKDSHGHLHPSFEVKEAASAVRRLLNIIYPDWTNRTDMGDTPARVARAFEEMLVPEPYDFTVFDNEEDYDQIVAVHEVPFTSLCAHHLLPFSGKASVGYIPQEKYAGLSKLARTVEHYAHDLQTQERMTHQIGTHLNEVLHPLGVAVVIESEHMCMIARGVKKPGVRAVTSFMKGAFLLNPTSREEFLMLARGVHNG